MSSMNARLYSGLPSSRQTAAAVSSTQTTSLVSLQETLFHTGAGAGAAQDLVDAMDVVADVLRVRNCREAQSASSS